MLSNSEGGARLLLELGARRAETVFWGADPEFFAPQPVAKETDVFFYGYGDKFRREWMGDAGRRAVARARPSVDFALGGFDFQGDTGRARMVGDVPFPSFPRAISAARVNVCLTRRPHASLYASSTCRPFELAAAGAAIVASPCEGIERWFEPGSELLVVDDAGEAIAAYGELLAIQAAGRGDGAPGARARPRRAHLPPPRAAAARAGRPRAWVPVSAEREPDLPLPTAARARAACRDRAGLNEERSIGGLLERAARARPGLEVVVVSDGSADRTAEVAAREAPTSCGCPSTSASALRCRPASASRSSMATSSRCASTATVSTIRPSCAPSLRPSWPARPTSRSARASSATGGYRSSPARRIGIRVLARVVSWIAGRRLTDTTSGFQALNRRAIALYAAELPHDYPEVEGLVMAIRHGLRVAEVPVTMRERAHGSSSIGALASVYYMIKVLLAVSSTSSGARCRPGGRVRLVALAASDVTPVRISIARQRPRSLLLLVVLELIRSRRLRERYALLWLATGVVLVVLSAWRERPQHDRALARREGYPRRCCSRSGCCSSSSCCCTTRPCSRGCPTRHDPRPAPGAARVAPRRARVSAAQAARASGAEARYHSIVRCEALAQRRARAEAEQLGARVQVSSRRRGWPLGIAASQTISPAKPVSSRDRLGELADRDLRAGADVDRLGAGRRSPASTNASAASST